MQYYLRLILRIATTVLMVGLAGMLVFGLWVTYMLAPWTRDGRVLVQVVNVAPEVSGTIVSLPVSDNQFVHKGDVLFVIDPTRFRLAVEQAQASVDAARQQQQQRMSDAKRRQGLTGVVSAEEQETTANTAAVASSNLAGALAALDVAKLNLQRSTLYSPVNGFVTQLRLLVGDYATAGQPRIAVIDSDSFWVTGYFEETKLHAIKIGDSARIKLMGYDAPLTGHVDGIGRGISDPNEAPNDRGLPKVNAIFTWVRLAQRVPVHIAIDNVPTGIILAAGMTASVSIGSGYNIPPGRLISWLEDNL
jgi:multidrug resistance efflux pump